MAGRGGSWKWGWLEEGMSGVTLLIAVTAACPNDLSIMNEQKSYRRILYIHVRIIIAFK